MPSYGHGRLYNKIMGVIYMELPVDLLKQFANITNDKKHSKREAATAYGIMVVDNEVAYVKIDGTDSLTPVSMTMDAQNGDRVMVMVKDHVATIVGNVSSPASARTADSFMKLVKDGLVIGELDESGNPIGTSSLIAAGTYYIVDEKGNRVASFSANAIKLGGNDKSEILLCNGVGWIRLEESILTMQGKDAVGLRSDFSDTSGTYKAEIVCKADSVAPVAAIQVYKEGGSLCSLLVRKDGIAISTVPGATVSINGNEIIDVGNIMINGAVRGTGSVAANSVITVTKKVEMSEGYRLAGIRQISTNHPKLCHITQFKTDPTTNEVSATFENIGSDALNLAVRIEWFALRSGDAQYLAEEVVEW